MNMNKRILSSLGWAILALTAVGCVQKGLDIEDGAESGRPLTVKVIDGGYQDKVGTRAGESNEEETDGESTIMRTRFFSGTWKHNAFFIVLLSFLILFYCRIRAALPTINLYHVTIPFNVALAIFNSVEGSNRNRLKVSQLIRLSKCLKL